jgi:hypothetical protein
MIVSLLLLNCCTVAAAEAVREVNGPWVGSPTIPGFSIGYYYWNLEPNEYQTTVYRPDGLLAFNYSGRNGARLQGIGLDADGTAAVAWWSEDGSGIDLVNAAGSIAATVNTGLFMPGHCAFAEDHSLWCTGTQLKSQGSPTLSSKEDYMVVRRYLRDGTPAGAFLPRSSFPQPGLEPDLWGWQRPAITITHDRVGLWLISGRNSSLTEWVELDLKGTVLGRWPVDKARIALEESTIMAVGYPVMRNRYGRSDASSAWSICGTIESPTSAPHAFVFPLQ